MANSTVPLSGALAIRRIDMFCAFYVGLFNLIVGLLSNAAVILVLATRRAFRSNQSALYLLVEAISNIGLLLTVYPTRIWTFLLKSDPVLLSIAWCKIHTTLIQVWPLCSVYTISLLAFEQYLSTNPRAHWRQKSTLRLTHLLIVCNVAFVVLHNSTFLVFADIQPSKGCHVYHSSVKSYYTWVYYPFLASTVPFVFTITLSLLAYHNVRHLVRRQTSLVRRRLDRQMTALTLARVLCLSIFGLPFVFAGLAGVRLNNSSNNPLQIAIISLIRSMLQTLFFTNFSVGR